MKRKSCAISTLLILFATFSNFAIAQKVMEGTEKQLVEHVKQVLPDQKYLLEITFDIPHPIEQIKQLMEAKSITIKSFLYTWGDHKGWYFLKEDQTSKEAISDFQNQLREFFQSMIGKNCPSNHENSSAAAVEWELVQHSRFRLIEEFENQLIDLNEQGLMLSGISLAGNGNELRHFVSSRSTPGEFGYHYTLKEIRKTESTVPESISFTKLDSVQEGGPYPDSPWKFSPDIGYLGYIADDVNNRYFQSEFYWTDASGFDSIHKGYEHDITIFEPKDTYVKQKINGLYASNLPCAYVDTTFMDDDASFTIGSDCAVDILELNTYYTKIPVEVIDHSGGPAVGHVQAQLSSHAGTYDQEGGFPEWMEEEFCDQFDEYYPQYCLFSDQIHTIGGPPQKYGTMYYNDSGAFLNFPFDHRSSVGYFWDKNYDPDEFPCPVGKFKGKYIKSESGNVFFIRCDPEINFNWGMGGPGIVLPNDKFEVVWSGQFCFDSGNYIFIARADDGIRAWLDDEIIIDAWHNQPVTEYLVNKSVKRGAHTVRVEYYEDSGEAVAQFRWEKKNTTKKPLVRSFAINNGSSTTTSRIVTLNNFCSGYPTHYMACQSSDFSGASWLAFSNAPPFELSPGNGKKKVYFKVKNGTKTSSVKRDTITLNQGTVPTINSFSINSGASSTTSRTVTLNNSCSGSPTHYMASESSSFSGASWLTYSSAPSFTLSSGNGTKTVYFKVKNNIGTSTTKYDTITLTQGTTPTVNSFSINNGASSTTSRTVTLNNSCSGSPTHYMASESSSFSGASWLTYSSAPSFTLSSGNGTKTVYFRVKNSIGTSSTKYDTITLTQGTTPTVNSFSINNGSSSTTSRTVTLNNSCSGSPTHYMASESSGFSGASWFTYSSAPSFTLSSGNGTKRVYFRVKNSTGTSYTVSDTIVLDVGITYITNPSQGVYTTGGNVLKMKVTITGTKITFTVAKQDNSAFISSGVMTIRAGAYYGCVANYDTFYWNYYAGQTTTSATFDLYFTSGTKEFFAAIGRPEVYCDGTPPLYYSGKLTVTAQ